MVTCWCSVGNGRMNPAIPFKARSPSSALLSPFLQKGSHTKIDYRKKSGTLILSFLLEDLEGDHMAEKGVIPSFPAEKPGGYPICASQATPRGTGGVEEGLRMLEGGSSQSETADLLVFRSMRLRLSKPMGSHFGVDAPILEPILVGSESDVHWGYDLFGF